MSYYRCEYFEPPSWYPSAHGLQDRLSSNCSITAAQ